MSPEKKETAGNLAPPASTLFSRLSIRGKLLGVMMIVTIFALLVTSATLISFQWLAFRSWTVQNHSAQVKIVADNSRSSLTFDNADDALDRVKCWLGRQARHFDKSKTAVPIKEVQNSDSMGDGSTKMVG